MLAFAVDMGGSHISCGVVQDTTLLTHAVLDIAQPSSLRSILPLIESEYFQQVRRSGACEGIAIGFPGIIDVPAAKVLSTLKKYEDAVEIDLPSWARERLGIPLRIENDARLALLGEHFAGAVRQQQDIVMMTLGTGIGCATLIHGRLLRGVHGHAGCLGGHLTAKFDGRVCKCGNIGCAEAEASGWALPILAREWPGFEHSSMRELSSPNFADLFQHAEAGDQIAIEIREHCLTVWAANAVSLVHAYDPNTLILGGGVMGSAACIIPFIQDYVNRHTWSSWGKAQVRAAELGNTAALLGAVPLLTEEFRVAPIELR